MHFFLQYTEFPLYRTFYALVPNVAEGRRQREWNRRKEGLGWGSKKSRKVVEKR